MWTYDSSLLNKNAKFDINSVFDTVGALGASIGGDVGNAIAQSGNVGRSIKGLRDTMNAAGGWKNLSGQQRWGSSLAIAGAASDLLGSFMPDKTEYAGDKGDLTKNMDAVSDGVSDALMSVPGWGMIAGGAMKAGKLLGQGINALGGGTSGMTTTDAILGSSFLNFTPIGLINGFGGSTTDTITKDEDAFAQVGSSYTGSNFTVDDALTKSGKKYGLFSRGAMNDANDEIADAKKQQMLISGIAENTADRSALQASMAAFNANRWALAMQGGYNQAAIRAGKHGMPIELLRKTRAIIKAQKGEKLEPFDIYYQSLPKNQQDSINFRVRDYWEFNGQPKDFNEAVQKGMFTKLPDGWHAKSVMENPKTGEIEYMKAESHPTIYMESDWYERGLAYNDDGSVTQLAPGVDGYEDWNGFVNNYELQKTSPYWKYVKRTNPIEQKTLQYKNGGSIIELINPQDIPEFQNGGSINVIPDGALHARKHNMEDADNLTKKGIPVVDNNGEQQAEIEKEELIIRLEVTQKLEELEKKYYDENSSQKEKDEYALEAGILLTQELLHNTKDNAKSL